MKPFAELVITKEWMRSICSFIVIVLCSSSVAQNIPVNTWRSHFSYKNARILTASDTKLFCAVENGLFSVDLSDGSTRKINKTDGLSDVKITAMIFDHQNNVLVLGYESGLIDLIYEEEIVTIRDFIDLRATFSKKINDVVTTQTQILVATDIGILVIPYREASILDNYKSIGEGSNEVTVQHITIAKDSLWAITSEGLQWGALKDNLLDFNNWKRIPVRVDDLNELEANGENLFLVKNDSTLCKVQGNTINNLISLNEPIRRIKSVGSRLEVLTPHSLYQLEENVLNHISDFGLANEANDFLQNNDELWLADGKLGLLDPSGAQRIPNGPESDQMTNLQFLNNHLYTFYGPKPEDFDGSYDEMGYCVFDKNQWSTELIPDFSNIRNVVSFNGNLYFGSIGHGVFDAGTSSIIDSNHPAFQSNEENALIISDLSSGSSLWMATFDSNRPLVQMTAQGEFTSYTSNTVGTSTPASLDISDFGVLWIGRSAGGMGVFEPVNDSYRLINTSSGLKSQVINDTEITVDDEVWLATQNGIYTLSEASAIFNDTRALPLTYTNGEPYDNQNVTAVASDGGGRIWVAGSEHLAVYNTSFSRQDYLFTPENSPLPSTEVLKMEYDPVSGEMYILTTKGLVSFRSNSSLSTNIHRKVSIFPNPVRPNYAGDVGISGLVSNANIKITDANGKLIRQISANGGSASWNLKDYTNKAVRSGIYLFFSSNEDGTETFVGKIAVIR